MRREGGRAGVATSCDVNQALTLLHKISGSECTHLARRKTWSSTSTHASSRWARWLRRASKNVDSGRVCAAIMHSEEGAECVDAFVVAMATNW